jgi:hypothetical protein
MDSPELRAAVVRALEWLGWETTLTVTVAEGEPLGPGLVAAGEPRLGWVVAEEVAHQYLTARAGIPMGGTFVAALLQGVFGTWAQYGMPIKRLAPPPLPPYPRAIAPGDLPPELGARLGTHMAVAALGGYAAQLDAWLRDPVTAPELRVIVPSLLSSLPWMGEPAELADALGAIHAGK